MNRTKTVIIADDEQKLRSMIGDYLALSGWQSVEAADGDEAVDAVRNHPDASVVIMDVMMPGMDGWEASRRIREFSDIPILMLTARSQEFDELMGFESGVDDYVTKPFSLAVLQKRIEALVRRSSGEDAANSKCDGLFIDGDAYSAYLDGEELDLTVKEFEILRMLFENPGRVFTRSQLLDTVWGYDYDGDVRTVDSHVARLRVKLGNYSDTHLKTVYGIGYKFEK
ncbi:MAG: response regulator transcription factor [Firmicutes bacterium]|nr:response regulator transcription factor [Bacillota bacterium]